MIHAETRQRVSAAANKLWDLLRRHIVVSVGDEDFILGGHAFDDHPHDKAVITCSIDGEMVIVCSILCIRVTFIVTGENKITMRASYRIGGPGSRPGTHIERAHDLPVNLDEHDTPEIVAKRAWSLLVNTLRPDVETLLAPYKAFGAAEPHKKPASVTTMYAMARSLKPHLIGAVLDGHVIDDVRLPAAPPMPRGDTEVIMELVSGKGSSLLTWDLDLMMPGVIAVTPNGHKAGDKRKSHVASFSDMDSLLDQLRKLLGPDFARKGHS